MNAVFILFAVLILAGCSGNQIPVLDEPTDVPPTQTPAVPVEPTATDTPAPTVTLTPSPTISMSPTATPKNFVLAEKGYDIADVRFTYQREDILVVKFKYRLDESRTSKDSYIFMTIPPKCKGNDYQYFPPHYLAKTLTGGGQFTFKMTLQGVCDADSLEFTFYPVLENPHPPFLYSEYVLQPYHLVRSFPTVNSDTIQIQNFKYIDIEHWSGKFTFDYDLSDKIPLPLEQYNFVIRGFGPDGGCAFYAGGPILREHHGQYQIDLYLTQNLLFPYQSCLNGLKKYTFTKSYFMVIDLMGDTTVYTQELNTPYTTWYYPDQK